MKQRILKYGIPIIVGCCLGLIHLNMLNMISVLIYVLSIILILIFGLTIIIKYLFYKRIAHKALLIFICPFISLIFLKVSVPIKDSFLMTRAERLIDYVEEVKIQSGNYPVQITANSVELNTTSLIYKFDEENDRFIISYDLTYWLFQTYRSQNNTWVYWNNIEFATKSVLGIGYKTNINNR